MRRETAPCRNAYTAAQAEACLAVRYKLEGRSWEKVARILRVRDVGRLREEALAHLELEGDRRGLLVHEGATPRAMLRAA